MYPRGKSRYLITDVLILIMAFLLGQAVAVSAAGSTGPISENNPDSLSVALQETVPGFKVNELESKDGIPLRMGSYHFDPTTQPVSALATNIPMIESYEPGGKGYYIVQFDGPIQDAWKASLKATGVEIFDYVPDFAFIISLNSDDETRIRALPHVRWLGIFQPAYKISPQVSSQIFMTPQAADDETGTEADDVELIVQVFPGEDLTAIYDTISQLDGVVEEQTATDLKTTLKISIKQNHIEALSRIPGIKWIDNVPEWELNNNESTDIINAYSIRLTHKLYGQGQTVAVTDTGLDQGHTSPPSLHDDFEDGSGNTRVSQLFDLVGDGADDVNSGHGTHVAGSVLGNGAMSGSNPASDSFPYTCFAGLAPKANLIFQAVENNSSGALSGIPIDLNTLFQQADDEGASLHTNSWGANVAGAYTADSQNVDEYIWNHPDYLILFSAGNNGVDKDADGVIDLYNLGSPASAKNCLTVGASEGYRPSGSGAGYDCSWGTGSWAAKYSADPIFSDHVSDAPGGMAAFSSRGPTLDGRYKPDIIAPGTNILSTRSSSASGTGWGTPYDAYYMWMGGTSMATPLTAGAAALMREYLIKEQGIVNPSAALLKATLLNSATDLSPGQHGTGSYMEIPAGPVPNNVEGWGRVNLGNGMYPSNGEKIQYIEQHNGIGPGGINRYKVAVTNTSGPLKINMAWSDYPGTPAAQGGLVNDLDLQVTDPNGTTVYYPDGASQASSVSQLAYDSGTPSRYFIDDRAMRFTPSSYPAHVDSVTFDFNNPNNAMESVDVVVYANDFSTELFRKTLAYVPHGWNTVPINGVTIASGDFYIALDIANNNTGIWVEDGNPTGRSYYYSTSSSSYITSSYTALIRANVRTQSYSTSFDRVNNVLGLTIPYPHLGNYLITVKGYNVPQGPQPYAIVIRGRIVKTEIDECNINSNWNTVTLNNDVPDPVLIAGPPTFNGPDPGVVRIRNVAPHSFEAKFQEWAYKDGTHTAENMPYLVISKGRHTMPNGSIWEAGTFSMSGTGTWSLHTFGQAFSAVPALFLTIQTYNGADPVTVRAKDVTKTGFKAAMFEEENKMDGHIPEVIGYLAIYSPGLSGSIVGASSGDKRYILQAQPVDHRFTPVLSSSFKIEEEQSADSETNHVSEILNILAVEHAIFAQDVTTSGADTAAIRRIPADTGSALEWGTVNGIDHNWTRVLLGRDYSDPVVVTKPVSLNGSDPGVVQVRNITHNSFELRFKEWLYKDGYHTQERVFYMVADSGSRTSGGLSVQAGKFNTSTLITDSWNSLWFVTPFSSTPAVFTALQTSNGGDPAMTHVRTCTANGFYITMDEEEKIHDSGHCMETVGWIAVEKGSGTAAHNRSIVVMTGSTNHEAHNINFGHTMNRRFPVVISDMNTTNGADPATVRYQDLDASSIKLLLQEETSADTETIHTTETLSLFVAE